MKNTIFVLILLAAAGRSYSQAGKSDSIRHLLRSAKEDTARCMLMQQLSRTYLFSDPDTAMKLAQEDLLLSKKIKYAKGEAAAYTAMGNVYDITGNYPKSLQLFLRALKINDSIQCRVGIAVDFGDLGIVYSDEGDERKSIEYTLNAKAIDEALPNQARMVIDLLNAGDSYDKLNEPDSARQYTQQCYELALQLNDRENAGIALNNLGNIYSKADEDSAALYYYRLSIPFAKQTNNEYCFCETTMGMAQLFEKTNQVDSCLHYARLSMTAAKEDGFTDRVLEASNFLTSYFESRKNIDSAFAYQKISIAAKDSLFSEEKIKQIQNLSFAEEQRQQEIAEQKLQVEERYRNNLQLAGIAVFIPTFFLFVLFLSRRKAKSRTVEFLGLLCLLLFFEFITLLIEPYIQNWANGTPVFMLSGLVLVAIVLVPLHHRTENWLKERLVHKHLRPAI